MEHTSNLTQIVILLAASVIAVPLFKKLGLGTVLGFLAAGVCIGPFGLKLISEPEAILHIAELGVVMFLFIIGLEMNPKHLWQMRQKIFGLGALQVGSAIVVLMGAWLLISDVSAPVAFVGAAGFVMTSTAIVISVLNEKNELSAPSGKKMFSILLFEDLLIVPLLIGVSFLSHAANTSSTPAWQKIALAVAAVAALFAVGKWLINPFFRLLAHFDNREVMTAAALLVVLGSAVLMDFSGLSMAMGAFMAGVMLSESVFRNQVEADIEPFRGLLLGLFFLAVGMSLDLATVAQHWSTILTLVAVFMALKALVVYGAARLTKSDRYEAVERSVLMAQGGEFAFVLYASAFSQNIISAEINAQLTAVIVISMALTPLALLVMHQVYPRPISHRKFDTIEEENTVVLVGFGRVGQIVNSALSAAGYKVTIIDLNEKTIWGLEKTMGIKSYYGDASRPELLRSAGIDKAKLLVIAIDDEDKALKILSIAKDIHPEIKVVARAFDKIHEFELIEAGADEAIRETFFSAIVTSEHALMLLGQDRATAEAIGKLLERMDEQYIHKMAKLYDKEIALFHNEAMTHLAHERNDKIKEEIQKILKKKPQSQPTQKALRRLQ